MEIMSTYNNSCLFGSDEMSLSDSNGTLDMSGLDVVWKRYCHNSIGHLVKETKACICLSLLKGSPTELGKHGFYA